MTGIFTVLAISLFSQAGHIMQGVGAVNMSMGGAATAMPVDINGPLQWNPAGISVFDENILSLSAGLFFSSPELSSTVPTQQGPFSGVTEDDRGMTILPSAAMVFGKGSKHKFGVSVFGISGFGVTFPENQMNPINAPQSMGGFGHIESDYLLLQVALTYAFRISDNLSIGIAPNINYAALELAPNPLSAPSQTLGYPTTDKPGALGFGAQIGILYQTDFGLNLGASYKSPQYFGDFKFENTYLDGSAAPGVAFNMDYPAIYSVGLGYSMEVFDLAIDYRYVDYKNTDGFSESGWTQFASVAGFGWENISIISAGLQLKFLENVPIRLGYTFSGVPIPEDLAFFSVPATAVIKNAFQAGVGLNLSEKIHFNLTYHYGTSGDPLSGPVLNPMLIQADNPLGKVPGSEVAYEMTTSMFIIGADFKFGK